MLFMKGVDLMYRFLRKKKILSYIFEKFEYMKMNLNNNDLIFKKKLLYLLIVKLLDLENVILVFFLLFCW